MSRPQKLLWYAEQLITDATEAEKTSRPGDATVAYLKAADILLLLAKAEGNYTTWLRYTDRAAFCQGRAKTLIASKPE